MSVTSISSLTDSYQIDNAQKSTLEKVRSVFEQFKEALASGTIDQAQQAFSALQNDLPSGASGSPMGQALNAVGQALQSGDITGAQQVFASLGQRVQAQGAHRHHHHHHRQNAAAGNAPTGSPSVPDGSTSTIGTLVNVSA